MDLQSKDIPTHHFSMNDLLINRLDSAQPLYLVNIKLRCITKQTSWRNTEINTRNVHLRVKKEKTNAFAQSSNCRRENPSTKPYFTSSFQIKICSGHPSFTTVRLSQVWNRAFVQALLSEVLMDGLCVCVHMVRWVLPVFSILS